MPEPSLLTEELFEDHYTVKFDALLAGRGLKVEYRRDRAAIDVGVMWTGPGSRVLTGVRVWFQLKGRHKETVSAEQARADGFLAVKVDVAQLQFWYAAPEATYLAVYVDSLDVFLARDVRDIVDERWGPGLLAPGNLGGQETVTVHVPLDAVLDDDAVTRISQAHRSMRIDGPPFRGRALGHRFDPLRSELTSMPPAAYEKLVSDILAEHLFRPDRSIAAATLVTDIDSAGHRISVTAGTLWTTYEYIFGGGVEYGFGPTVEPRSEGRTYTAFGKVVVIIHSQVGSTIDVADTHQTVIADLAAAGYEHYLVFANCSDHAHNLLFPWRRAILDGRCLAPQGLHSLAYNVLVTTRVYLDNVRHLSWTRLDYNLGADAIDTAEHINSLGLPESNN